MAVDATALADSGSEVQAAPSEAAGSLDPTHGEQAEQTTETQEGEAAPPADESGDPDDPTLDPSDSDSEEEVQTKAQKRRARRQARDQERIQEAVNAELAKREVETTQKATADKAAADAKAAEEAFFSEFGSYVGTPDVRSTLDADIATLTTEIANLKPYAEGTDLDVLEQKQTALQEMVGKRSKLNENKATYDKIDAFQFRMAQREWAAGASSLPAEHQQRYLNATNIPDLLKLHEDGIVARERAAHKAVLDATVAEWSGKLAKEETAHAATRTGAPGAGPAPNGSNGMGGSGPLTRDQFLNLPKEQKDRMRRDRPDLVAEIYSRSA